jgi:hypothetical protein
MAADHLCITTGFEPANYLQLQDTHENFSGYLATVPYRHNVFSLGWGCNG